jgi:hypothetical protein
MCVKKGPLRVDGLVKRRNVLQQEQQEERVVSVWKKDGMLPSFVHGKRRLMEVI